MTKRSKKASEDVRENDAKVLIINTAYMSPLSGLELPTIENKQENLIISVRKEQNTQINYSSRPLSGTTTSQKPQFSLHYGTQPSSKRSCNRVCYTKLLHNNFHNPASKSQKPSQLSFMGSSNCYTQMQSFGPSRCERSRSEYTIL